MLSAVLFLSVLTLTSMSKPQTERGNTSAPTNICEAPCACRQRDNILKINCQNRGLTNVQQFHGPLNESSHLFLEGNSLKRLSNNEFINFDNLITSLYLGNNRLEEIQAGAFNGLAFLKRLQLNNNVLDRIEEDTLAGLESLEYLQLDSNSIKVIKPGAFRKLNKLKVLILNNNLLLSLPPNVFRFLPLSYLDLRGNRLKMLPFSGVLEHIGSNVEVQLQENPWNCTCDLIPLQSWLDDLSVSVGDIVCETPSRLHAKDITKLKQQDLCPRRNAGERVRPPADSHFQGALLPTYHPGIITPPTTSPGPMLCPSVCVCTSLNPDSGLNVLCQNRKVHHISELKPKPSFPKTLQLTTNYLEVVYRTDLTEYGSLERLHLRNNRIEEIQEGAFNNLTNLRRLYLNENRIRTLSPSVLAGLENLQYLNLESNLLQDILPQTFNGLHNLQLLFLNHNRLRSLPDNVFGGTMLTRLDLRNNLFSSLPVRGVLVQLTVLTQIDLQENPWNCTCDLVALKNWMELSSNSVVVPDITCLSPSQHAFRQLGSLPNEAICPKPSEAPPPQHAPSTKAPTDESHIHPPELHPLVLGVFILFVCLLLMLSLFVLEYRRRIQDVPAGTNPLDLNSLQVQNGSNSPEPTQDEASESPAHNNTLPMCSMCQNPLYMQKDGQQVAYCPILKELKLRPLDVKKEDVLSRSPGGRRYQHSGFDGFDGFDE